MRWIVEARWHNQVTGIWYDETYDCLSKTTADDYVAWLLCHPNWRVVKVRREGV